MDFGKVGLIEIILFGEKGIDKMYYLKRKSSRYVVFNFDRYYILQKYVK